MRRIVPTLLLVALLGACMAQASGNGIRGRVTSSPTCPVETMPPQPGCEPRGFAAKVRIYRLSDRHTVKRLTTGSDGRFTVGLGAGRYGVVARPASGASLPRCPGPVNATVRPGRYSHVAISCDSGIR